MTALALVLAAQFAVANITTERGTLACSSLEDFLQIIVVAAEAAEADLDAADLDVSGLFRSLMVNGTCVMPEGGEPVTILGYSDVSLSEEIRIAVVRIGAEGFDGEYWLLTSSLENVTDPGPL